MCCSFADAVARHVGSRRYAEARAPLAERPDFPDAADTDNVAANVLGNACERGEARVLPRVGTRVPATM